MTLAAPACPASPWLTQTARIVEVVPEMAGIATYRLEGVAAPAETTYRFQPGQFNMLYLPGVGEAAISMSGDSEAPDAWVHTVRVTGNITQTLADQQVGDMLGIRGPFGVGWPMEELRGHDIIIVAGGLGLAPLRPVIYHLGRHRIEFGDATLIIGARTPQALLYSSEYDAWRSAGIDVYVTVDRAAADWTGNIGVVTSILDRLPMTTPESARLLTCGPEVMMKYAAQAGIQRGIAAEHIWVSMERNMQCAIGLCGHCQWGAAFLCKDGPVLRYDRIQPYFAVESL